MTLGRSMGARAKAPSASSKQSWAARTLEKKPGDLGSSARGATDLLCILTRHLSSVYPSIKKSMVRNLLELTF